MNKAEFSRLMGYWRAKTIGAQHRPTLAGRRHIKGRAKHVGIVLANSSIKHTVQLETVFQQPLIGGM